MSDRRPIGELIKTGETKRAGEKGRPKALYRDSTGYAYSKPTRRRHQHWANCMRRSGAPRTSWPTEYEQSHPEVNSVRLAYRWITVTCSECGGVKYAIKQFGTNLFRKRPDGTWYVRTRHLKRKAVHHPERAKFLRRPKISCKCFSKRGRPRPNQVAELARSLEKAANPEPQPIRSIPPRYRRESPPYNPDIRWS